MSRRAGGRAPLSIAERTGPERGKRGGLGSREGGARTGGEGATAAVSRAEQRAMSRWERLDGGRRSGSESDPEEELEQLRRQVRARVKAASWGNQRGTGVAALERRLRGLRDEEDDVDDEE